MLRALQIEPLSTRGSEWDYKLYLSGDKKLGDFWVLKLLKKKPLPSVLRLSFSGPSLGWFL